ncbi:MAG: cryptochrome/photolyase family protein [Pseudomonadota bacterium]
MTQPCRNLILILGDQLDAGHPALPAADPARDHVLMIECAEESTHVWTHKHRITVFLAAMRHYAEWLRDTGWTLTYRDLDAGLARIVDGLDDAIDALKPEAVWVVRPGEWRLLEAIEHHCADAQVNFRLFEDDHFYDGPDAFAAWARGRKSLTMEYFYREQRKRFDVLMDGKEPAGGSWNYDADNRQSFGKAGPRELPDIPHFEPDAITRAVIETVNARFPEHPGQLDNFGWAVTRDDALAALQAFIETRLPLYGRYQDAMWQGEPFLYHALIGASLNVKLINPREAVEAAEQAWRGDPERYPLAAVEGFIRQILGWREFIRGVYWHEMPDYKSRNHFAHERPLPAWFWTGDTRMNCLKQCVSDTLENGYAHHIQRLMVIGNYATLAGLLPADVCDWFLAVYVDAVEWVELPNVLGMALHGDGGVVGSKPYVASGAYINRMSNYCKGCSYSVTQRTGDKACPFNALYWDFLARHREALSTTPRMRMVLKNLDRWSEEDVAAIEATAQAHRDALDAAVG